jgi:RHS repeat-associated protein
MTFEYDTAGRLETQAAQGLTTTFEYDDGDTLRTRLKRKVMEGSVAGTVLDEEYTYDAAGRVRTVSSAGQNRTISYFADGAVRRIEVDGFLAKDVDRDQAGRILRSRVGDVEYTFSGHDGDFGLPAQETLTLLGSGRTLTKQLGYDSRGRLSLITLPTGSLSLTYDGFGHRETITDPDGVVSETRFHPGGLLRSITFGDGNLVTYTYNSHQRLGQMVSAAGIVDHDYDDEGLVRYLTYPDGAVSKFEQRDDYFEAEQVTHGAVVQAHTWNDGRLEQIKVATTDDTLDYSRDELGRLVSAELNGVGVEMTYNATGQLTAETTDAGTWEVSFDNWNRLLSETYPSGLMVEFAPDQYGLPTTALEAGLDSVTFLGAGFPETFNYSGGLTVTRHYDGSLRLERITYSPVAGADNSTAGFEYELSAGGRVQWEKRLHDGTFDVFARSTPTTGMRITNFQFSASQQTGGGALFVLTNASFVHGELRAPAQGLPVDPRGFFPALTQAGQRVSSVNGVTVGYDSFGSVTNVPLWVRLPAQTGLTEVEATLDYDGLGMLRKITRADGVVVEYVRDGMGRIAERMVSGAPALCRPGHLQYAWKGNRLIEEREHDGAGFVLVRRYLHLGNTLVMVQAATAPGAALQDHVPLVSLNGSVRGYLRPDGQLEERIEYSAYGYPVFLDASGDAPRPTSSVAGTVLFQGGSFDEATGLYQLGQRNLHPLLGRFLQRDSVLFSQSLALFTAFNGDPIGRIDPFGTDSGPAGNLFGGINLKEAKKKAKDLGETYKAHANAIYEHERGNHEKDAALGSSHFDLLSKIADLGTLSPDAKLREQAETYKYYTDVAKNTFDVVGAISGIRAERQALATVTASSLATISGNFPKLKGLAASGATVDPGLLRVLDRRYGQGPLGEIETVPEFDARTAYGELKKKRADYADKREENLLNLGKGLNSLAKEVFTRAYKNDESHGVKISKQIFEVNDKVFDLAEKYRKARKADDLQMMFLTRKHGIIDSVSSKAGRSALSASYSLGFEAGKLGIMLFSDPDAAKAYEAQVKQFDENGGWLTVAGGILSTLGADDTAYLIQQYSDFKATDLLQPVLDERERNLRRTEYYLNGLSAP